MKAKKLFSGLAIFVFGIVLALAVTGNTRHRGDNHHAGVRKSAVIEVGAPLTVSQLKSMGFI